MGVKWTTLTFKELAAQRTLRMDAKYWIKKKASSRKPQASGLTIDDYRIIKDDNERIKYAKRKKRCLR